MSQSVSLGDDVGLTGIDFRVSSLGLRASRYDSVGHEILGLSTDMA